MNRIGVFVFYQKYGHADIYVLHVLESMSRFLDELIIVVNGVIDERTKAEFRKYTDKILLRENKGYDGGAYKYAFAQKLSEEALSGFDELILFNDTFYGPLLPWNDVFALMEGKDVDFWGLSKHIRGSSNLLKIENIPEHLQAYFLVINKKLFKDKSFGRFWSVMEIPASYREAVVNFEINFTRYFARLGFRYASWLEEAGGQGYVNEGGVVYVKHIGDIVQKYNFPVIKRKACSLLNYIQIRKLLDCLDNKNMADENNMAVNFINASLDNNSTLSRTEVSAFYDNHERVFIYGHGEIAQNLREFFIDQDWNIEAFIVTEKLQEESEEVRTFGEIEFRKGDGIIAAVGIKYIDEIRNTLNSNDLYDVLIPRY